MRARHPDVVVPPEVRTFEPFVHAGLLDATEVHIGATFARLHPDEPSEVLLALAMAARGPRLGHVCVHLDRIPGAVLDDSASVDHGSADPIAPLPWPDPARWRALVESSSLVATPEDRLVAPLRPLVLDGDDLYLHRYHRAELTVAGDLASRAAGITRGPVGDPRVDDPRVEAVLDLLFGEEPRPGEDRQRRAARIALSGGISVLAGGPGTGKTRTVARLLAAASILAAERHEPLRIALAAPTGKAAARMTEALHAAVEETEGDGTLDPAVARDLRDVAATTLHRLLGYRPGRGFRHDADDPLPHDVVIVDETSMVSLPLLAALLGAVRAEATLVLVGDPAQLASIEAGTVMADIVGPHVAGGIHSGVLSERVTVLTRSRRFGDDSGIAALAESIRNGDVATALAVLEEGRPDVTWVRDDVALARVTDEVVQAAVDIVAAASGSLATDALAAAERVKVLTATRRGPSGLGEWSERIELGVSAALDGFRRDRRWSVGRPVIVTANDHPNHLANGDVGVVVAMDGTRVVAFRGPEGLRYLPPARLDHVESWWAMTIHKSQGSEFDHAVVSLSGPDSPIMTRELLYTAVTRARSHVTVVGDRAAVVAAIERPILRASGLRERLWPGS